MPKDLLIHAGVAETCIALIKDGELERYWQEQTIGGTHSDGKARAGDIVLGRVSKVLPSMEAAFVDIGTSRAGFLSARDSGKRDVSTRAFAREGEAVLLQVAKEPIAEKGARLSGNLAIPGRYLVLLAEGSGVSASRRIEDETERARLTAIVEEAARRDTSSLAVGYIVRTAAMGADAKALQDDVAGLMRVWRGIVAAREKATPPAILYREIGLVERVLRDEVDANIRAVLIDDAQMADNARGFAQNAVPALAPRIEHWTGAPLFEAFDIEDSIAALESARVELPSGGWITIEATEALTAIDVNSGRHASGGRFEDVSLAVNLEAAEAIARQLSLREVGGLIVIDFIHLSQAEHIARLTHALRTAMGRDRTPAEISPMSEFGLVAITRKRERDPLSLRHSEACSSCDGHGRRKIASAIALDILRRIERTAAAAPGKPIVAFAAPEVVEWLRMHEQTILQALARRGATQWRLVAEPGRARDSFAVETHCQEMRGDRH